MHTKQEVGIQEIYDRITQLERRLTMDWYNKEELFKDLFALKENIYVLSKKHEMIKECMNDYYQKIDNLIDQLL